MTYETIEASKYLQLQFRQIARILKPGKYLPNQEQRHPDPKTFWHEAPKNIKLVQLIPAGCDLAPTSFVFESNPCDVVLWTATPRARIDQTKWWSCKGYDSHCWTASTWQLYCNIGTMSLFAQRREGEWLLNHRIVAVWIGWIGVRWLVVAQDLVTSNTLASDLKEVALDGMLLVLSVVVK